MKDEIVIGEHSLPTLIALTEEEQRRGLMGKQWPPPIMCFPSAPTFRKFWMANTPSPLDIVFCRNSSVISIHRGVPFSTTQIGPNEPSDLVVELPAGTVSDLGIHVGDSVTLRLGVDTIARKIGGKTACFGLSS